MNYRQLIIFVLYLLIVISLVVLNKRLSNINKLYDRKENTNDRYIPEERPYQYNGLKGLAECIDKEIYIFQQEG